VLTWDTDAIDWDEGQGLYLWQRAYSVLDGSYVQIAGVKTDPEDSLATIGSPEHLFTNRQYFENTESGIGYELRTSLMVFADDEAAADYLVGVPEQLEGIGEDIEERTAASLGDESLAFTYTQGQQVVSAVYVQVGATVARVTLHGDQPVDDIVDGIAGEQMSCLESGDSCEPVEVPVDLVELAA
jgi:hypothetical protein